MISGASRATSGGSSLWCIFQKCFVSHFGAAESLMNSNLFSPNTFGKIFERLTHRFSLHFPTHCTTRAPRPRRVLVQNYSLNLFTREGIEIYRLKKSCCGKNIFLDQNSVSIIKLVEVFKEFLISRNHTVLP